MSTDGQTPAPAPAAVAPNSKPTRSPVERLLFWGFVVVSLGLVAFEARAKYGYDMTLAYLNTRLATEEFKIPKKGEKVETVEVVDPTWVTLQTEPFEKASVFASFLPGSAGEIKRFKPVVSRYADGTEVEIRDKNGTVLEVQPELNVERTIRWHSLRDLWEPQPAYQLTIVLATDDPDADVVAFDTSGGKNSLGDYFENPERLAPGTYDPDFEPTLSGPGGPPPEPAQAPTGEEKKEDADKKADEPEGEDKEAKTDEASETKTEKSDGKTESTEAKKEDAKSDDKKSEEDGD